jgi:hypothetical protein
MIHRADHAFIQKSHRLSWRVILVDKWGGVVFYHHYDTFEGAREFVEHQVDFHAHARKVLAAAS